MSEYADNYMTDEKNVHWVKMDYVGPIMKKTELAMDKLEADNKVLEDALKMLWNDVGGGKKKCGHDFCCSCAGDNAKKVLNRLTTNRGEE